MPYVTVADFRDADTIELPDPPTDAQIQAVIDYVEPLFDRICRQWFELRSLDFRFDGNGTDVIHLGVPVIAVDALYINDDPNPLDPALYRAYLQGDTAMGDRRGNPRVCLIRASQSAQSIYVSPIVTGRLLFQKGRQNCRLVGDFGYLDNAGNTPAPVIEAIERMVVEYLQNPAFSSTPLPPTPGTTPGVIVEEETDDHRIKYAVATPSESRGGLSDITSDLFVQRIMKLYRAPIGVATPIDWATG